MDITVIFSSTDKDHPVQRREFLNVANPGVVLNAFLQINETNGRVREWIPLSRIENVQFENNTLMIK